MTITVTDGTNPISANLTLGITCSGSPPPSSCGGYSPPAEQSVGTYLSSYNAPPVTSQSVAFVNVTATSPGYLTGQSLTQITLNPFPPLTVSVTAKPRSINPGGSTTLMILVENATNPLPGARISVSSDQGGSFTNVNDLGNGNYTVEFSADLQSTSPTLTIQASKSSLLGQTSIPIQVVGIGIPDPNAKAFGVPVWLIAGGALVLFLMTLMALVASRKKNIGRYDSLGSRY